MSGKLPGYVPILTQAEVEAIAQAQAGNASARLDAVEAGKADKLAAAVAGYLATLDASGNLGGQIDPATFEQALSAGVAADVAAGNGVPKKWSGAELLAAILANAPVQPTWDFISSGFPIPTVDTPSQVISAAHGFGVIPSLVDFVLRCVVAEFGYSPGDIVTPLTGVYYSARWSLSADSTSIYASISYANSYLRVNGKDGSDFAVITKANWEIVLRARK